MRRLALFAVAALGIAACAGTPVRDQFAREYACSDVIDVSDVGPDRYVVAGCGHTAQYTCGKTDEGRVCVRDK